jgi:diguanylate cyclase (GGDEF)-like protein/PAS domain S-box-containing protein
MEDPSRTNPELIKEISALKQKIRELEQSESERKRASEALLESEEYFKAIIQNSSDIILILDRIGAITYASPSIERFLGYEPEELIGKRSLDLIMSDEKPRAIADFGRALLTKEVPIPNVFRMRHKNGTERILEGIGNNLFDNPMVAGFVMNVRDITDRKQVEEALRKSEEKFRLLIENAPDAIYVHADARFIYLNHAAVNLFGAQTADHLIGSSIMDRYDPDYHGMITQRLHDLYEKRKKLPIVEQVYLRLDGSSVPVEAHAVPITYNDKNAALTFVRVITERKKAEKALRESEERLRSHTDNSPMAVVEWNTDFVVTRWTGAAEKMFGWSFEETIGKPIMELRMIYEEDIPIVQSVMQRLTDGKPKYVVSSNRNYTKKGEVIHCEWYNSVLHNSAGKMISVMSQVLDITDRKLAEEALKDSEKRYRELSIVDDLTRLYNSRHFYFQLKNELDRSNRYEQPLTLLLLDLDNFKAFNDAYGHVEGDQVLWRLGQVVKRCLRQTDSAYRYGGEEFTIILPMTTSEEGTVTAERIRAEFKKENFSPDPGKDVNMTVSIGLAQYKPQEEMKAFVHRVDQLMYQGKKNGKDRVCYESS